MTIKWSKLSLDELLSIDRISSYKCFFFYNGHYIGNIHYGVSLQISTYGLLAFQSKIIDFNNVLVTSHV